jgi:hypothetical protein
MSAYPTKPGTVTTLEMEMIRLMMFGRDILPKANVLEEANFVQPHFTWDFKPNPEGYLYFVGRCIIPVSSVTLATGVKPWLAATEIPGAAVLAGTAYTS